MLLFCYLVHQQGSSSPQAPCKRSSSFNIHTEDCLFLLKPREVNDMPVEDKEPASFSSLRALVHRGVWGGGQLCYTDYILQEATQAVYF